MNRVNYLCAALAFVACTSNADAAESVNSSTYTYSQDFDSLAHTSQNSPLDWTNNSVLQGWSLFDKDLTPITKYRASNGSGADGSFYSYGSAGSTERALGVLASGNSYFGNPATGAVAGWIAVAFANNAGADFNSFTVRFDGEQWRNSGSTTAQKMSMQFGFGGDFDTVITWHSPGETFNWASPTNSTPAGSTDGNAIAIRSVGGRVKTSWKQGDTLWIRWADTNDSGNDHGLAIDNFSFSVAPVPEPETYAMLLAGLALVAGAARRRAMR